MPKEFLSKNDMREVTDGWDIVDKSDVKNPYIARGVSPTKAIDGA